MVFAAKPDALAKNPAKTIRHRTVRAYFVLPDIMKTSYVLFSAFWIHNHGDK
jgi:hypothetical protein